MNPTTRKALLTLVAVLMSVIVAMATTWLTLATGTPASTAVLYGGGAFGGTLTLLVLVLDKLGAFS
jgi:hypothetical protein